MSLKINLDKPHFLFDGSSNGIVIGDVTTYDGLTGFTIECWVRLTLQNTVTVKGIVSKGPYYSTSSSFNLSLMERSKCKLWNECYSSNGKYNYNRITLYPIYRLICKTNKYDIWQ